MRNRLARLGAAAVGLLALVGVTAPPAQAITTFEVAFVGVATVNVGLGYPCVGPGSTVDLALCPPKGAFVDTSLPLPHDPVPQPLVKFTHNRQGFGIATTTCAIVDTNVNKPGKAPVHVNAGCGFTNAPNTKPDDNTVAGNCGLSSGQARVNFNDGLGQTVTIDVHFFPLAVAGEIGLTGHWFKPSTGQNGLVVGQVTARPPVSVPGTGGQSCTTKNARDFSITGTATGTTNPLPL